MAINYAAIGIGEGGGRLASAFAEIGVNVGIINTNQFDLNGIKNINESKKLLVDISEGGSGKDPNFVKESIQDPDIRKSIGLFIKRILDNTPLYTICSHCNSEDKIKDTEAIGDQHVCAVCSAKFGIKDILKRPEIKHNYLFLTACLGGGSGSGLISDVIDICYTNFNVPLAVICTIPDDTEDSVSKTNAIAIFKELYNKYATAGIISPFILVDNQKMLEMFNLPIGSVYSAINNSVAEIIKTFNEFSNQTSFSGKTVDVMDTVRLWAEGGCCALGKFTVGNNSIKKNKYEVNVETFYDLDLIEDAMNSCTFVDGFDLSTAKGVGVIAVAPDFLLNTEEASNCIKYVYGKVKELIGDGMIYRAQYENQSVDCVEFYLFYNGLKYPEKRFARMWQHVKEGKVISDQKKNRMDTVSYDVELESATKSKNFTKMKELNNTVQPQRNSIDTKPTQKALCQNCFLDPVTKKSLGIYNKRGPKPFTGRICPMCNGTGRL